MIRAGGRLSVALVASLLVVGVLGWLAVERLDEQAATPVRSGSASKAVPVEVAPVQRGPMELKRTFSGALEPRAQFVVAPKVSGRVVRLYVNLADPVKRGQVVAELDNDEYVQDVAQARANLAVAQANVAGAQSALDIANRELERMRRLNQRGVASEAQFDTARANQLDKKAQLAVAQALVKKAEAELRSADIRLGYTKVTAAWHDGSERRYVSERVVDEGATVDANQALLTIVELSPLVAVVFVPERDYAQLNRGQTAVLTTDAFPQRRFEARIERIAPIFREASRQARVELVVDNPQLLLKPGMFVRATIVLERIPQATHVPEQALTSRNGENGVFVVNDDGTSVSWKKVSVGIREAGRVQLTGAEISGQVVILGQQLLEDGSTVALPPRRSAATDSTRPAAGGGKAE